MSAYCSECGGFIFHEPDRLAGSHTECRGDLPLDGLDLEDQLDELLSRDERQYHVIVINERTGEKTRMTRTPVTHKEGCVLLSKLTDYAWRRKCLEEVIHD